MAFEGEVIKELCAITGRGTIQDSLRDLRLLGDPNAEFDLIADKGWYRGGAETYCLDFTISQLGISKRYIIKALVAFSPGTNPNHQLTSWSRRRVHLEKIGIPVCPIYGVGSGVFIELFLEYDIREWMRSFSTHDERMIRLRSDISIHCRALAEHGYNPICILPNYRVQDDLPYWVDFGSDLGDPNHSTMNTETLMGKLDLEWSRSQNS